MIAVDLAARRPRGPRAQRVGEAFRRIDGDHAGPAALARAFEREHGRDRRLADAAAPAAHQHVRSVTNDLTLHVDARHKPSIPAIGSGRQRTPDRVGSPISGVNRKGSSIRGSGSRSPSRSTLLGCDRWRSAERRGGVESMPPRADTKRATPAVGEHVVDRGGDTVGKRLEALVHDHRAERDAGSVFDRERGVDHLAHRCLLGQRHQHHLAALRIGEQLARRRQPAC